MNDARDILRRLAQHGVLDVPEVAVRLSTGLDGFVSRWERETLPFLSAGGSELRFVEGPNGRGKTHFLQVLETHARRAGFVTCRVGTQTKPFAALQDTYREIASSMTSRAFGSNGICGLAPLLAGLTAEQLAGFQQSARGNPGYRNLITTYARRAQAGQTDQPATQDLRALLMNDTNRRVTFGELFRIDRDLPRPLGKLGKRNAGVWLRSLLTLPRQLGFKGLVVLFDETGADLHLRPEPLRARQQHMANLRNLVDHLATGGIPGCSVVYATTNDFIHMAFEDYPAMWQRVARLEEASPFAESPRNPRAVWCRLDELTDPSPAELKFFITLGEKLLALGDEAGVSESRLHAARQALTSLSEEMANNITQGAVRQFIKRLANEILRND
jgi:hypothetical protein